MAGKHGVKETREALLALVTLGKFVADRLKDGAGLDDAMALGAKLVSDAEFKSKVMAGVQGAEHVPAEIKELDIADLLELAKVLPDLVAVIKAA